MVEGSEIRYAEAGEHHIAYREYVGDPASDVEIVMVNGMFWPMESLPDDPVAHRLLEGLAGLGRLVVFDRRGVALSDPVTDWETPIVEQWADDLAAVIEAARCGRPAVFSWNIYPIARTCAVRSPGSIGRLILWNPGSPLTDGDRGWAADVGRRLQRLRAGELAIDDRMTPAPARADDPSWRAWLDAAGRAGASPSQAARLDAKAYDGPTLDQTAVRVPTLVLTRVPPRYLIPEEFHARAARSIPDAEHRSLSPGSAWPFGELTVDDVVAEISRYLTGDVRLLPPERQLAAILFTDLVDSTRRAASTGDAEWKRLLDRHDAVNRTAVGRRGGEVVKTTGDGVLALLPTATAAIGAARSIRERLREDDLDVRIGIHVGEFDRRGDDVSGLAVNVASRVMSEAATGQILVSDLVPRLAAASTFEDVGDRTLKGVEGTWRLFEAV